MENPPKNPGGPRRNPANVNAPPEAMSRKRGGSRRALSRESRFIGYLVLGFGVIALLAVLMLYMSSRQGDPKLETASKSFKSSAPLDDQNQDAPPQTSLDEASRKTLIENMAGVFAGNPAENARKEMLNPKTELLFERQPQINPEGFKGEWTTTLGDRLGFLKMDGSTYQIVISSSDGESRNYSMGTYANIEDIIVFSPRLEWKPDDIQSENSEIVYQEITKSPFPVLAAFIDGRMHWQNPPFSETRTIIPYNLPFMLSNGEKQIVWERYP